MNNSEWRFWMTDHFALVGQIDWFPVWFFLMEDILLSYNVSEPHQRMPEKKSEGSLLWKPHFNSAQLTVESEVKLINLDK